MNCKNIVIVLTVLVMTNCSGTIEFAKLKPTDIIISLQKGACFGKCAVYKLDIYKNNMAVYTGTANTDKLGVYSKLLNKTEISNLRQQFIEIGFMGMQDQYPSYIEDFPLITITYKGGKKIKTVSGKEDRPETLKQLQLNLERIANSSGWKQEVKHQTEVKPQLENVPEIQIDNEIIIEPAPNVHVGRWLNKYDAYGAYLIKKIAPNLNLWLITWDTALMKPTDFLSLISQDKEISKAEFNKVISPREH